MTKLIELWKTGCVDCEKLKPTLADLEKDGFEFGKLNITSKEGGKIISEYKMEIIERNKKQNYDPSFLYTPTLINPQSRETLFYPDKPPTKGEIVRLAKG